jgi:hypothetical protein
MNENIHLPQGTIQMLSDGKTYIFFWLNLNLSTKHFYLLPKLLPPNNYFISFRLNLYLSTKPFYILGKPLYFIVKFPYKG